VIARRLRLDELVEQPQLIALWAEPDALIPASIIKALEGRKA
jgi:hypothetical protein